MRATHASATTAALAGGTAATFSVVAESSCGPGPAGTSPAVTPTGASSTYLGSVLTDAPSAFYRLDEQSDTVMADSSGNGGDGSYSGQETLAQGAPLASDPASSTGYTRCCSGIGTTSPIMPQYNSPRTIEAWVNTTSATANQGQSPRAHEATDRAPPGEAPLPCYGFRISLSSGAGITNIERDAHGVPAHREQGNNPRHAGTARSIASTRDIGVAAWHDPRLRADRPAATQPRRRVRKPLGTETPPSAPSTPAVSRELSAYAIADRSANSRSASVEA